MRLTTKGRFAVTAMLDLALNQIYGIVTLASISTRQKISLSYLEQLFGKLRRQGLVKSRRGPGGGYTINGDLDDISITAIIKAVDEPIDATLCGERGNCTEAVMPDGHCITHKLWKTLNLKILDFLSSVTIQDLVDNVLHNTDISSFNNKIKCEASEKTIISKPKDKIRPQRNLPQTPMINSVFNLGFMLGEEGNEQI